MKSLLRKRDAQLPCRCGNEDPSLFAPVGGETACLVCAYAERRGVTPESNAAAVRVLTRERNGVAAGTLLPAAPFAEWLRGAATRYDWNLLVEWSGWHDKGLREVRDGVRRVVPTDAVDRLLSWWPPGDCRLDDLYPDLASLWRAVA